MNGTFFGRFLTEGGGVVRVGSQLNGFAVDTAEALGTSGADIFEFRQVGNELRVTVNSVMQTFDATVVQTLYLDGLGGNDYITACKAQAGRISSRPDRAAAACN